MTDCLEFELAGRLGTQDVDREIAFTLLSQAYEFDRREIDQVIAYIVHADGLEMGRLVIAPGTGANPQVRLREHYTSRGQPRQESPRHGEFVSLCHHIRHILESLQDAGGWSVAGEDGRPLWPESTGVGRLRHTNGTSKDSDHFAYPRSKRAEIVQHYRFDRVNGQVRSKDQWARRYYQISGKTLFNYECEFPEAAG